MLNFVAFFCLPHCGTLASYANHCLISENPCYKYRFTETGNVRLQDDDNIDNADDNDEHEMILMELKCFLLGDGKRALA